MKELPEIIRKTFVIGLIGAFIGGCIGGYFTLVKGSYNYAVIGFVAGFTVAYCLGFIIGKGIPGEKLVKTQKVIFLLLGTLCFLTAFAGILGFFLSGKWIGVIGAVLFILCGIFLFKIKL